MKDSNDTIGNRTRDLLTCSAVPQPTAPPQSQALLSGVLNSRAVRPPDFTVTMPPVISKIIQTTAPVQMLQIAFLKFLNQAYRNILVIQQDTQYLMINFIRNIQ